MKRLFSSVALALMLTSCASVSPSATPTSNNLHVTTTSLQTAKVGEVYHQQLTAVGGTAPYSWVLTSGKLPPGITLTSSGLLLGIPAAPGQFTFTVRVADSKVATTTLKIDWSIA